MVTKVTTKDAVNRLVWDFLRDILRSLHSLLTYQMLIQYESKEDRI
jgi:hypothetical protein